MWHGWTARAASPWSPPPLRYALLLRRRAGARASARAPRGGPGLGGEAGSGRQKQLSCVLHCSGTASALPYPALPCPALPCLKTTSRPPPPPPPPPRHFQSTSHPQSTSKFKFKIQTQTQTQIQTQTHTTWTSPARRPCTAPLHCTGHKDSCSALHVKPAGAGCPWPNRNRTHSSTIPRTFPMVAKHRQGSPAPSAPSSPNTMNARLHDAFYPLVKLQRNHGRTVTLVLVGALLLSVMALGNTSTSFSRTVSREQEARQRAEHDLAVTKARLDALEEALEQAKLERNLLQQDKENFSKKQADERAAAMEGEPLDGAQIVIDSPDDAAQVSTGDSDSSGPTEVEGTSRSYPIYESEGDDTDDNEDPALSAMVEPDIEFHDQSPPEVICPGGRLRPELFSDAEEYRKSEYWQIPEDNLKSYQGHHWATQAYEQAYRLNPPKVHVPHLNVTLSAETFVACFMNTGMPVIIPMHLLRKLGLKTPVFGSVEEMMKAYPVKPGVSTSKLRYKANGLAKGTPDLGPALLALSSDEKKKMKGIYRNYPRNMKLTRRAVGELGFGFPPYHNPRKRWQLSTIFFGGTTADTPNHSDCCDNWCTHILGTLRFLPTVLGIQELDSNRTESTRLDRPFWLTIRNPPPPPPQFTTRRTHTGTKRWVLSPPTETRYLTPRCFGGLCWGKATLPLHPTLPTSSFSAAERRVLETASFHAVDVHAGEILYLPSGWFHAVYNLSPTVSLINWVASGPSQLYVNVTGKTGGNTSRKNQPCLPGMAKC